MFLGRVVTICGFKDSGKTSILEGLVEELVGRGYEVGTAKHIPHGNYSLNQEGTDTQRHISAGSDKTVALGPEEVVTWEKKEANLEDLLRSMYGLDYVVMEGFKNAENVAKIAVTKDETEAEELDDEFTVGFIGNGYGDKPALKRGDSSELADLVEEKAGPIVGGLDCKECGYDSCRDFVLANIKGRAGTQDCAALKGSVTVRVDGKSIPLKSFIKNIIANTLEGMIESLKETEGDKIEIEIRKDRG